MGNRTFKTTEDMIIKLQDLEVKQKLNLSKIYLLTFLEWIICDKVILLCLMKVLLLKMLKV